MQKIGEFFFSGMVFKVWQSGNDIAVSCDYCGLVELSAWCETVQIRAKSFI